jgi:hypothetical protein
MVVQPSAEDRFVFFGIHQINPYSMEIVTTGPVFLQKKSIFFTRPADIAVVSLG